MITLRKGLILFIAVLFVSTAYSQEKLSEEEQKRKELNEKFDKLEIRYKNEFVVDSSEKLLVQPGKAAAGDYSVATNPPEIKMMILPDMVPEYFPEGEAYMVAWANWAHMTRSDDNRFFFSVGDHRGSGCQINLYEYSPARDIVHKVLDVDELLGWTRYSYTDGKIHGYMGIMPDGTLWGATHYGVFPDSSWFANGYRGSWLLSYNINTHEAKNHGVPLVGSNLACFCVDTRRGILLGTGGLSNTVLCYDTINGKTRYAGYPPNGWIWYQRAMMCDTDTGKFWGIDLNDRKRHRFLSFNPEYNKFERYDVSPPAHPEHGIGVIRCCTDRRAMDGWFYWSTMSGNIFRFEPEGPEGPVIEPVCLNWDKGCDVLQFALDKSGRYIYYFPVSYDKEVSPPLVQFDVKTGKKKVLCWLEEYYFEKYGYWVGGTYGIELTEDDSTLIICMNGSFQGRDKHFGKPSLFVVGIPEEERLVE